MPLSIGEIRHDAAALQRFVDSIAFGCDRKSEYPSYGNASKEFFEYIAALAQATNIYLSTFVAGLDPNLAITNPNEFLSLTQVLRTIRMSWFQLHELVKPALDADTLHVPYPLVNSLAIRLRTITGLQDVQFAVLHSTKLNYFQIGASDFRSFALQLAGIIPGAPQFPPNLGIIALPYSQASSVFPNVALAHEMGHFAFQERDESSRLTPLVVKAVQRAATNAMERLDLVWCKDRVLGWCEEIYCDLFALWLIGPSFSFSFIELFAMSRLAPTMTPGGSTAPAIASLAAFGDSHPASAFRLAEHVRFLKNPAVGWWGKIQRGKSHYLRLLTDAESLEQSSFRFSSQSRPGLEAVALTVFFGVVGEVTKAITATFAGVSTESDIFEQLSPKIAEYLSYGVVPSTLSSPSGVLIPTTVSIVNAAHLFYMEDLDKLIDRIKGAQVDCLECRALWSERVEMWTSKALEDVSTTCR